MYSVYADNNLIYSDSLESMKIIKPVVTLEVNRTGSFKFTIYPDHPHYAALKKLKTIVTVYQGSYMLFRGRILNDNLGFRNEKNIECEGELAFLNDSIQRPYTHTGSITDFISNLITNHNSQVEEAHRFTLGNVTVTDNNNYITRSSIEYTNTWTVINEKLIKLLGGYIQVRHEGGANYIDYLNDFTTLSSQKVEFAKNLLDLKRIRKGENIATALIPLGAKQEGSDERLTIKSVNQNKDYIYNAEAVAKYGWIFATHTWDDVTVALNLKEKASAHLGTLVSESETIELSAADLASIERTVDSFRLGTYVQVTSNPHGINQTFLVTKLTINLLQPGGNKLTLGGIVLPFTERAMGNQGEPGAAGKDGATFYTWIKYSQYADGTDMTDSPAGAVYIGIAYNKTTSQASSIKTDYSWSKIKGDQGNKGDKGEKGDQGERGLQGLQGEKGDQGIPGTNGTNGKTTYFHIKYSENASGNPMTETPSTYIGTYVDYTSTDSSDYTKYKWSRFQGSQGDKGDQGIPGTNGTNGKTSYLHIAYATSADGSQGFDVSDSTNKTYIGQYTDFKSADSSDYTKYKWSKIKGDKGDTGSQGIQGEKGADGKTYYTWLKYADSPTTGMSDEPTGKAYIGLAYNKTTATESTKYSDYTWSLIKGEKGDQGVPGGKGADGNTYYTWVKYATSSAGANMSDDPTGKTYIGLAYNKTTATESTVASDYTWSLIKGDKGDTGATGATGATGKGVKAIKEQYYLSTSSTTQSDGSWQDTQPAWEAEKYIWTRSYITWSDNTTSTTTPVLANALNTASSTAASAVSTVNNMQIGGRNLLAKTAFDRPISEYTSYKNSKTRISKTDEGLKYTSNGSKSGFEFELAQEGILEENTDYTLCFEYRGTLGSGTMYFLQKTTPNKSMHYQIEEPSETEWKKAQILINIAGINERICYKILFPFTDASGWLEIKDKTLKLEKGNKATDWTPAPEDVATEIGQNVKSVDVQYYLSTSAETLAGGSWQTEAPAWVNGKFIWSKTITTLANGTTTESPAVCITGAQNATVRSDTAPTDTTMLWIDTTEAPPLLKRYNTISNEWEAYVDSSNLNTVVETIYSDTTAEISKTSNNITTYVSEKYYLKSDTDQLISDVYTNIEQTAEDLTLTFGTFQKGLESLEEGTDDRFLNIQKYIRFVDGNIVLGEVGNELELQITKERISFFQNNNEVAYFSNSKLYVKDMELKTEGSMKLGNFAFIPRDNGNLSFKKIT